jgi:hypothetical protein
MNASIFCKKQVVDPQQVFQNLQGRWYVQRTLAQQATMKAIASFTPIPESLAYFYEEKGKLQLDKKYLNAYKQYIYRLQHERIGLYTVNPTTKQQDKLLYQLNFFSSVATPTYPLQAYGTHICQADIYKAYYEFLSEDTFYLTYYINGPHKNWRIKTHFSKIGDK